MNMKQSFNRRHSPNRRRTKVPARLHVEGDLLSTVVLDVSYEGMKVSVKEQILPGTAVTVEVFGEEIPSIVHWCDDEHAGLHLLRRLKRETLLALENADDELADFR